MCGRYASPAEDADIVGDLRVGEVLFPGSPSWNVAPTQTARIVVAATSGQRRLGPAQWGLVPAWATDDKGAARTINARIETVQTRPAYRDAVLRRRALVPAGGYYEWERTPLGKVPHLLHDDGRLMTFAGLWDVWQRPGGGRLVSFTILTRAATPELRYIHDRAPVVVPSDLRDKWLDPRRSSPADVASLLGRLPVARLTDTVVGSGVNAVSNDGPDLARAALPAHPPLFG